MITPPEKAYTVRTIASSITENGERLDTLYARYPRMVHSEVMAHREKSRNASSSRAIPNASILTRDEVIYVPTFKKNKKGMQPGAAFGLDEQEAAEAIWVEAAETCRRASAQLAKLGVHKELANRPLEWFGYIDVLISSPGWTNFDGLRRHGAAQEEIRILAELIHAERERTTPRLLKQGEWHLPYVTLADQWALHDFVNERGLAGLPSECQRVISILRGNGFESTEYATMLLVAMSAARSCRISYSKVDGSPTTLSDDMTRFLSLAEDQPKHASPLEHQGRPLTRFDSPELQGNFKGFAQFRKFIHGERM